MKKFKDSTEYFDKLRSIKMSEDRKQSMREELSSYADFADSGESVRITESERLSWYTQIKIAFISIRQNRMIKAGILIAVLATTGGTSLAAQNSVPGDTLYPVKVHVNENIRGAVALGANAKVRHQGRLLSERIAEVETLLDRGELTEERAVEQSARISSRSELMYEKLLRANTDVRAEVQADVVTRLDALHTRLSDRGDSATVSLTAGLVQARSVIQSTNKKMELDAETDNSIESVIEVEVREKEVRESLESAADVSAEVRAELKTKLDSAVNVTAEARADIESNVRSTVNNQIDTAKRLINEVEAELNTHSTTSVETETRARGGVNGGSRNDVEVEVDAGLESGSIINTDSLEVESSKTIEGNTTTRIGL